MFKPQRQQSGFAIVELVLIIVILGIIAFAAWRVIEANGTVEQVQQQAAGSSSLVPNAIPPATKTSDLDTLNTQLDDSQVDDDTELQLQSESTF